MAEAKIINGRAFVAHVAGVPVDSEGNAIPGGPKPTADTHPSQQPTAALQSPEEKLANALATALKGGAVQAAVAAPKAAAEEPDASEDGDEGLPTLEELPAHLETLSTADDVKALRKTDKRKGAKPLYAARLAALDGE